MLYLCPGMKLGGHQLVRRLRDGESRQVFAAIDVSDQRPAVVKIAALECPEDAGRLEREFIVLREAAGPGVAAALGHTVALPQGMAWLVLAAHGPSLASVLVAVPEQRLSAELAMAAAHAAATSLGALHARGWCHGDLKPGNLLCNADGSVVLSDLEFAGRLTDGPVGQVPNLLRAGTPPFVAPELWREGVPNPSTAADVWALGVTLFLCLFGDYPFGYEDNRAIAEAIDRGLPPQLAQLPEPLSKLLKVLLARDLAERPSDGREAARLIANTAQQLGVDLIAARQVFGRLVAAQGEDESPPEPGTVIAAPSPAETPSAPRAPQRPPGVGAGEPRARPEGVGAASSDDIPLWLRRDFLDLSRKLDVSSKAVFPPPQPCAPTALQSQPSPALKPPSTKCFAPTPPAVSAAPSPQPPAAPSTPLVRRAAARWYRRMNPARNFPLSVVFSGKEIRIVGGSGLGITLGRQEIVLDPGDPVLSVEPWFPGCLISPPRAEVHVSQEDTVCRFWVTPLVCGDLSEACVTIRYRGKVVETLATPAQVVTRTLAKVLAALGLVSPIASKALDFAGWNPGELLRRSLPYAADLLAGLGPACSGLCVAGLLLAAALGYFYVTRPLLSEGREPNLLPQHP